MTAYNVITLFVIENHWFHIRNALVLYNCIIIFQNYIVMSSSSTCVFWINDPSVLLNKDYIFEVYPKKGMTYEERLNAITRMIIILTAVGYFITLSVPLLFVGITTITLITALYMYQRANKIENFANKPTRINERLDNVRERIIRPDTLETFLKSEFEPTNRKNPLQNVLLTDINDNPNRKSAPPSFSSQVYEDINDNAKKLIQDLNPSIKNTNKQLFGDLKNDFEFDQSMWNFYSTANTKVTNDQGAFANFLYGNMPSAKEGDPVQLVKDNVRYNLY